MWIDIVYKPSKEEQKELLVCINSTEIESVALSEHDVYDRDGESTEIIIPRVTLKSGDTWNVYNISYDELISIVKSPNNIIKTGGNL